MKMYQIKLRYKKNFYKLEIWYFLMFSIIFKYSQI